MASERYIETYTGLRIMHGEDGFFASNGSEHFGYSDTIEELRDEIDDYWQGDEHGPLNGFFTAAECDPLYGQRMDSADLGEC